MDFFDLDSDEYLMTLHFCLGTTEKKEIIAMELDTNPDNIQGDFTPIFQVCR